MRTRLIAAREAKGWTQQELADRINKDRTSITHYELGDCDIPGKVLIKLAEVLGMPMDALYAEDTEEATTHA